MSEIKEMREVKGFGLSLPCGVDVFVASVEVNQEDADVLDIDFSFDENTDVPVDIIKEETGNEIVKILEKYAEKLNNEHKN